MKITASLPIRKEHNDSARPMTHSYKHNHEALVSELTDKELANLQLVAAREWRRRRKAAEKDQGKNKDSLINQPIETPPSDVVDELQLIRDDLIAGKAIPQRHRQFVRSVAYRYPEWVARFGLPTTVTPSDWVYARVLLRARQAGASRK